MLTIGIDYTSAIHQSAGIGRYTHEMVRALAALTPTEKPSCYRLFMANAGRLANAPLPGPNFRAHPTRLSERWLARLWFRLHVPLRIETWTGPLDLFHAPDFFLPPLRSKTRSIVTIHDLSFVREPETVMPGMGMPLNSRVPRSVARADHVIAVSEATRQDLIELYGTPPEKITTLYHGVNSAFRPVNEPVHLAAIRQKYKLEDRPFILSVGTIQPRKNYQRLIQAFARLAAPLDLVIVGSNGWGYEPIFAEVEKQGLSQRVHFPGFVSDADLPALYSAAELFVYPSLYEGFGLPALEAMACGTPVIAANRSALPEVVGKAGLLVDPLDVAAWTEAMARVLGQTQLRQQLSAAGKIQASRFTWEGMAGQLWQLYQEVSRYARLS